MQFFLWARGACSLLAFQACLRSASAQASSVSVTINSHSRLERAPLLREESPRRGVLPAPAEGAAALEDAAGKAHTHSGTSAKQFSAHGQTDGQDAHRQERQASQTWRSPRPKPFPVLQDPRLTDAQKEQELARVMEKLHFEFFLKKEMGHSRLSQARASFYQTVADYKKLTGRDRPDHFHFEELPKVDGGAEELETDKGVDAKQIDLPSWATTAVDDGTGQQTSQASSQASSQVTLNSNIVHVGDKKHACLSSCSIANVNCNPENVPSLSKEDECLCLQGWQACGLADCSTAERSEDFFTALNTYEQERCEVDLPGSTLDELITDPSDEGDTGDGNLLQRDDEPGDLRSYGIHLQPLLQTQERGPTGSMNAPTGCSVGNPDALGDGNCDGGSYNTAACNYDGGDCCAKDCRKSLHTCGTGGYQCLGERKGVQVNSAFKCSSGKVTEFSKLFDDLRDRLTTGDAMVSTSACKHLTQEEHANVAQGFNVGITLGYYAKTQSAAAQKGGPEFYINCKLWDDEMGNDWFGTLVTHELGHLSGYSHPKFTKQVYYSECENIGSSYCAGHCMEWTRACENHGIFGSESCGFAGFGCKTRCVHSDYCYSLPERLTECFGYQKVHSREESLADRAGTVFENTVGFNPFGIFGGGASPLASISTPIALACMLLAGGGATLV